MRSGIQANAEICMLIWNTQISGRALRDRCSIDTSTEPPDTLWQDGDKFQTRQIKTIRLPKIILTKQLLYSMCLVLCS